ncbi:uncharacterized protein TNCV_1013281 [Trichonephila clavipes]|uniref:Uncharacterized protein n=1 Tax=Trichonephila clavipes TaxID=2585209 RepID=A0A8X6VXK7_TRICX|nr:uncharacterized protein TNCV_1013281 [Trichonephila clavipes]
MIFRLSRALEEASTAVKALALKRPCMGVAENREKCSTWLLTAVPLGLGSNPGEDMDACKCIVPSWYGGTLNSRRAVSPLVRLVEGEERWEAPDHLQVVEPLGIPRGVSEFTTVVLYSLSTIFHRGTLKCSHGKAYEKSNHVPDIERKGKNKDQGSKRTSCIAL